MIEVKRYVAEDGKEFKSIDECERHEIAVAICKHLGNRMLGPVNERFYDNLIELQMAGYKITRESK